MLDSIRIPVLPPRNHSATQHGAKPHGIMPPSHAPGIAPGIAPGLAAGSKNGVKSLSEASTSTGNANAYGNKDNNTQVPQHQNISRDQFSHENSTIQNLAKEDLFIKVMGSCSKQLKRKYYLFPSCTLQRETCNKPNRYQQKYTFFHQLVVLTTFVILYLTFHHLTVPFHVFWGLSPLYSSSSISSSTVMNEDEHAANGSTYVHAAQSTVVFLALYAGWHSTHPANVKASRPTLVLAAACGCMVLHNMVQNYDTATSKIQQLACILCFSTYFVTHAYQDRGGMFGICFYVFFTFALVVMMVTIPHANEIMHVWCFAALWAAFLCVPYMHQLSSHSSDL